MPRHSDHQVERNDKGKDLNMPQCIKQLAVSTALVWFLTATDAIASVIHVPGSYNTNARSIDGDKIVGWYEGFSTPAHGFIYDGMTYTTLDVPGALWTNLFGIDGSSIVGYYEDADALRHGFLYDGTTWTTLDFPGAERTGAYAVDGTTIVGTYFSEGTDHGFLYDGATWTSLDFPMSTLTYALGVSGNNVVGLYLDNSFQEHGFLYNGSNWTTLDFPNANGSGSVGIDGTNIVGYYRETVGGLAQGYLYDGTTWSVLLNLPGADDMVPTDIYGNSIVGFNSYSKLLAEHFSGFQYCVPEPSSSTLLCIGAICLGLMITLRRRIVSE